MNFAQEPVRGFTARATYTLGAGALLAYAALVLLFLWQSWPALSSEGPALLLSGEWFFRAGRFGALAMIYGTAVVSALALALAAPVGIGAAIFTAELLPPRARLGVKVAIELLAGIPSVVYGLLGVLLLRGFMVRLLAPWDPLSGDTLATAGVLLAVMILPTVMTLSDDALAAVPRRQKEAARSLGLSHGEVVLAVSLPEARSGLAAALLLGLGRALGETIAVFLVVGRQDNQLPERLFSFAAAASAGQTLTSKLGGSETAIAYGDPQHWGAISALGLILLALAGGATLGGARLARGRSS